MDDSSNTLMTVKKKISLDDIFIFKEPKKSLKRTPWGFFLHSVTFTILERIGNGLDDLFVFKEPEKEVKRKLHDASLHNVNFLQAWKETEMDLDLWY